MHSMVQGPLDARRVARARRRVRVIVVVVVVVIIVVMIVGRQLLFSDRGVPVMCFTHNLIK